ncbi:MAG: alpha/beta fold hydrolase, partial [Alphaproteobacteria bacterium]|nr:alpha/beta fold hydrolase [Alphaproteobacteria bacterium]
HPALTGRAAALRKDMKRLDPEKLQLAVMAMAQSRLAHMLGGIRAYQHHPWRRKVPPVALFTRIGTTEVRDYGRDLPDDAPVMLAVPSLVNPAYILDLGPDHSLMRTLAAQGIHSLLLDWTTPGKAELAFGLEEYILRRLVPAIRELQRRHHKKIHLLGYCMGGNLSLAAAQILRSEDLLASLTLIATPWDFHAAQPAHLSALTAHFIALEAVTPCRNAIPMNIMQMFFFSLDPTLSDRKFRKFYHLDPDSPKARNFVAIEDWANDGAPLASKLARDCLINWYQQNQPGSNCWTVGGETIDPNRLTLPGHIITPGSDRIVPPASAQALLAKLPHFSHTTADGGHVTMIAGEQAKTTLWPKIASYLK